MIMQLAGAAFRQWQCGTVQGGKRDLVAPTGEETAEVEAYTKCAWRREDMSFLEFLRKSNTKGEIAAWLKRAHKTSGSEENLEKFANAYRMRGEQIVAVDTVYRLNDAFYLQWLILRVPFRSLQQLRLPDVFKKVPKHIRGFALALTITDSNALAPPELQGFWRDEDRIRAEMKEEADTEDHIVDVLAFIVGQAKLVDLYMSGALRKEEETASAAAAADGNARATEASRQNVQDLVFNQEQLTFEREIAKRLDIAKQVNHSGNAEEAEEAREVAMESNRPVICLGPPGTGKTTVALKAVARAAELRLKTLVALPTAQLASRMRARLGNLEKVDVDTLHAAFKIDGDEAESYPLMTPYDLVVIDELSQLDQAQFERVLRLWRVADRVPALVFLGDKWQLPGVGGRRAWESPSWRRDSVRFVKLIHPWRCKDDGFRKILDALRTSTPTKESRVVEKICRGHKAWYGNEPNVEDIRRLLREHPNTMIITCTRKAATKVNALALEALHPRARPLAQLPGDVESNPENYIDCKLKTGEKLRPLEVPIYKGMKLYLTQNIRKREDYVNGMACTVQSWYEREKSLAVKTATGKRLMITPWTDVKNGKAVYYPIRPGYACNVHKVQGDEFKHVTFWPDVENMPAAAYTALSRVQTSKDYLIGGRVVEKHFVPAF